MAVPNAHARIDVMFWDSNIGRMLALAAAIAGLWAVWHVLPLVWPLLRQLFGG